MATKSEPKTHTAEAKTQVRADLRKWLDKFEAAALSGKDVTLKTTECAKIANLIRRVQDEAAVALGYEPPLVG